MNALISEETKISFPVHCDSVGKRIEYVSRILLPNQKFQEYIDLMAQLLDDGIHYVDPVHEFRSKSDVLTMLAKYVPRTCNDKFQFQLLVDTEELAIWRWTIALRIRFTPFEFIINGLVHAQIKDNKIIYQREYYDPMESIGVIPFFGRLYKLVLKMG